MKEIRLNKLHLENFMRFRDFDFEPNGYNATITGKNRLGKTTIASAFAYSLFGKDIYSNPENQFSLKTKDENDQVIEMIDHIVENTLSINGEPLVLKRNYRETRTKKNHKLTGHTTDFWLDNEPGIKKKDFEARIAEIISFDLFKMLTSVTTFADLPWKTRREQLFKICGDVNEDALGAAEKAKKIVTSKKQEIEKKKAGIIPRVDEKNRDLAALIDLDRDEIQTKINELEKQIQDIKSDSTRTTLLKERADLEAKLSRLRADQAEKNRKATGKLRDEISDIENDYAKTQSIRRQIERNITDQTKIINAAETEINGLYSDWDKIIKEVPDIRENCPTCGKAFLPEEKEAVQAEFNLSQSKKKEKINRQGKIAKGKKKEAETEKNKLEDDLKLEKADIGKIKEALDKKKAELKEILSPTEQSEQDKEIIEIQNKVDKLTGDIQLGDQDADTSTLEYVLGQELTKLAKLDTEKDIKARIEELKTEEKEMAAAIEKLEADLCKSEQKLEGEAMLVEKAVNQRFVNDCGISVQFQLFQEKLNTSIQPCCKIIVNGNEYAHGTSTSEECRAGLVIIKVLSEFYGVICPLFLDRGESLTDPLPEMDCQIISLIVDKNKEKLEIIIDK